MHAARMFTLVLASGALLVACGESDEEKAQNNVCDARADIQQRVDDLAGLTVTSVSIDRVTNNLDAIGDDLQTIADERENLAPDQRQAVEEAGQQFRTEVEATAQDVVSGAASGEEAGERIGAALDDLAKSFSDAYGPVDCD
jgi:major membrane immunogen (membrane-anchored lipoprotein)